MSSVSVLDSIIEGVRADVYLDLAVGGDAGQRLALDLHQHHRAVGHGDRAFRKLKAFGDEFEVEIHGVLPASPRVSATFGADYKQAFECNASAARAS